MFTNDQCEDTKTMNASKKAMYKRKDMISCAKLLSIDVKEIEHLLPEIDTLVQPITSKHVNVNLPI